MTLGNFIAAADRRLAEIGGYEAEACLDTRTVCVFHRENGTRVIHGTGPFPEGVAMEDAARDLLNALAPTLDPEKLAFADQYFVVGFA